MFVTVSIPDVAFLDAAPSHVGFVVAQYLQAVAGQALLCAVAGEPLAGGAVPEGGVAVARWGVEPFLDGCDGVAV